MTHRVANDQLSWSVKLWRIYLLMGFFLGVGSLIFLLRIPSEAAGSLILGLTPLRLFIAVGVVVGLVLFGWLLLRSWREPDWFEIVVEKLENWLRKKSVWGIGLAISLVGFFGGSYTLLLTPEIAEPFTRAYFERLAPIVFWFTALSLQTLVMLFILRARETPGQLRVKTKLFLFFVLIIGIFFGLWSWLASTQFESESKVLGWNETGVPILETQVLLAWVIGMLLVALVALLPANENKQPGSWFFRSGIDLILCLAIWLGSVLLWSSIPLVSNWFLSEPTPPNYEFYPNSDALTYDLSAQQLLAGEGFQFLGVPYARRPMHTLYLMGLHAVAGQDYELVVNLQVAMLSLLPVMIYLLTKSIHQRFSGIFAALLLLLREANAIAMAGVITTSHVKLLMVDLPATLCVVSFVLVMVTWLKGGGNKQVWVMVAGGVLGVCMLIRVEFGAMVLASLLVIAIYFWKRPLELFKNIVLFLIGFGLLLSPWIWRNYEKTGKLFLDSPSFRIEDVLTNIEQRSPGNQPVPTKEQGEIDNVLPSGDSEVVPDQPVSANRLVDYLLSDSGEIARYVFTHSVHSQLQVFLTLPTTFRPLDSLVGFIGHRDPQKLWEECCSAKQYPRRLPYWFQWDGRFPRQALIPLILNVFIVMVGIHTAWKNYRLVGALPLVYALTHILTLAVVRKSGGRYILPADWIGLVYYSIGLAELTVRFLSLFWKEKLIHNPLLIILQTAQGSRSTSPVWRQSALYIALMGIFLVGCSLPIVEKSIHPLYNEQGKSEMLGSLLASDLLTESDRQMIEQLIAENGGVSDVGRALYPRYYRAGEGEPGTGNPMSPLPYSRLGFYLVGPANKAFILPLDNKPAFFPNGSDVVVISNLEGEIVVLGIFEHPGEIGSVIVDIPDVGPDSN
jgi:hypothetical protein